MEQREVVVGAAAHGASPATGPTGERSAAGAAIQRPFFSTLLVLRYGQELEVRDAETGRVEKAIKAPNGGALCGLSPDGRYALVDDSRPRAAGLHPPGSNLTAVDLVTGDVVPEFETGLVDFWCRVGFTPDGRRFAYCTCRWESQATEHGSMHTLVHAQLVVREVGTWRAVARHDVSPAAGWAGKPAISPDGRFVAHSDAHGASLREVETGRVVREFRHRGPTTALAFSPDGRTLAAAAAGTPVYLWDLTGTRTVPA
ncbi:MAG: hypothetical protein K2X82_32200, partial [Gemmataceae bacterium]|nr:hypothetical protein [Gemmataceae bacterium]